jgi:hypothetical protein
VDKAAASSSRWQQTCSRRTEETALTGGIGKYKGIRRELTHTRRPLRPSPTEGVFPGVGQITGSCAIT